LFEYAINSQERILKNVLQRLNAGDFLSLNSLADAGKPFIASLLSQIANRPILIVTDGLKSQEAFFNDLQTLLPGVQFYPAWETLPHEDVLPHADTIADRLKALTNLNAPVTVASVQALMQRTFAPDYFMSLRMEVRLGQEIELQDFLDTLAKLGYRAEYQVNDPGDMAMRGGIVDFFPLDRGEPVRVEFSGNEIESIRTFDPITQQSREKRDHLVVTPAGELGLLKQAIDQTAPPFNLSKALPVVGCLPSMKKTAPVAVPINRRPPASTPTDVTSRS